jgi:hypothetical protein
MPAEYCPAVKRRACCIHGERAARWTIYFYNLLGYICCMNRLYIKNMVCNRCILVVRQELESWASIPCR